MLSLLLGFAAAACPVCPECPDCGTCAPCPECPKCPKPVPCPKCPECPPVRDCFECPKCPRCANPVVIHPVREEEADEQGLLDANGDTEELVLDVGKTRLGVCCKCDEQFTDEHELNSGSFDRHNAIVALRNQVVQNRAIIKALKARLAEKREM